MRRLTSLCVHFTTLAVCVQVAQARSAPRTALKRVPSRLSTRRVSLHLQDDDDVDAVLAGSSNATADLPARLHDELDGSFTEAEVEQQWKWAKRQVKKVSNGLKTMGAAIGLPVPPPSPPGGEGFDPGEFPRDCIGSWKMVTQGGGGGCKGKNLMVYAVTADKMEADGKDCPHRNGEIDYRSGEGCNCRWGKIQKEECVNCKPGIETWFVEQPPGPGGKPCNDESVHPPPVKTTENKRYPCPCSKDCVGYWETIKPCKPCEPGERKWKTVQRKEGKGVDCKVQEGFVEKVQCGCNRPCEEGFSVTECQKKPAFLCTKYTPWFCKYLQTLTYKIIAPARGTGKSCTFESDTEFVRECKKCEVEGTCSPADSLGFVGSIKAKVSGGTSGLKKTFRTYLR